MYHLPTITAHAVRLTTLVLLLASPRLAADTTEVEGGAADTVLPSDTLSATERAEADTAAAAAADTSDSDVEAATVVEASGAEDAAPADAPVDSAGRMTPDELDTLLASFLGEGDTAGAGVSADTLALRRGGAAWVRRLAAHLGIPSTLAWLRKNGLSLLLLAVSAVAVWLVAQRLFSQSESRRFLTGTRLSIMDKEVQRACRYVEKHYAEGELNPTTLCEYMVTGESFLEALFTRELGMSVGAFIEQVRVNRVNIALERDPDTPVGDLAGMTGFDEESTLRDTYERVSGTRLDEAREAFRSSGNA